MNFIEPFEYPLRNKKRLVIGGLMVFPGLLLLLIPFIMALGYLVRVAERTIKGQNEPPEFNNWGNLFIKGLGFILISIVYIIIIAVIVILTTFSFQTLYAYENIIDDIIFLVLAIMLSLGVLISVFIVFILLIISAIALVKYSDSGSVREGVKFGEIWRKFRKKPIKYVTGYILYLIILSLAYLAYFMLVFMIILTIGEDNPLVIVIITYLIFGIMHFYPWLFLMRIFAQLYKESEEKLEKEYEPTSEPDSCKREYEPTSEPDSCKHAHKIRDGIFIHR